MADPWKVHTLVFDLDDTLFLERDYVMSGIEAAGRWAGKARGIYGLAGTARSLFESGVREKLFDRALSRLGIRGGRRLVPELVAAYRSHRPALKCLPDALEILLWAKKRRFGLALLTDGHEEVQRRKIDALRIGDAFRCQVLTDTLGRESWKPSPIGFQKVMRWSKLGADGHVYIGDNPHKDFLAPRMLGWRSIRIRRPEGLHAREEGPTDGAAEREITSLAEMKEIICGTCERPQ